MCVQAAAYMKILPLTLTSIPYVRPHPHLTLPNLYSYPIEDIRSEVLLHHDPYLVLMRTTLVFMSEKVPKW